MDIEKKLKDQESDPSFKRLFSKIKEEVYPGFTEGFSERIIQRIKQQDRRSRNRLLFVIIVGVLFFLGAAFGAVVYSLGWESLKDFVGVTEWAIVIGVLAAVIQVLDNKLVRKNIIWS